MDRYAAERRDYLPQEKHSEMRVDDYYRSSSQRSVSPYRHQDYRDYRERNDYYYPSHRERSPVYHREPIREHSPKYGSQTYDRKSCAEERHYRYGDEPLKTQIPESEQSHRRSPYQVPSPPRHNQYEEYSSGYGERGRSESRPPPPPIEMFDNNKYDGHSFESYRRRSSERSDKTLRYNEKRDEEKSLKRSSRSPHVPLKENSRDTTTNNYDELTKQEGKSDYYKSILDRLKLMNDGKTQEALSLDVVSNIAKDQPSQSEKANRDLISEYEEYRRAAQLMPMNPFFTQALMPQIAAMSSGPASFEMFRKMREMQNYYSEAFSNFPNKHDTELLEKADGRSQRDQIPPNKERSPSPRVSHSRQHVDEVKPRRDSYSPINDRITSPTSHKRSRSPRSFRTHCSPPRHRRHYPTPTKAERKDLEHTLKNREIQIVFMKDELAKLKKVQADLLRKTKRSKDGHNDPLLEEHKKLEDELLNQLKKFKEEVDEIQERLAFTERSPSEKSKKESFVMCYFDAGSYWCKICNAVFKNLNSMIDHLHKGNHTKNCNMHDRPWEGNIEKEEDLDRNKEVGKHIAMPIKGTEFLFPINGFYCIICKIFIGDGEDAEEHCKGNQHNKAYDKHVEQNPAYETKLEIERQEGLSMLRKKEKQYVPRNYKEETMIEKWKRLTEQQQFDLDGTVNADIIRRSRIASNIEAQNSKSQIKDKISGKSLNPYVMEGNMELPNFKITIQADRDDEKSSDVRSSSSKKSLVRPVQCNISIMESPIIFKIPSVKSYC